MVPPNFIWNERNSNGENIRPQTCLSDLHEGVPIPESRLGPRYAFEKPLTGARIAVVTTAGFVGPDQPPFDASIRGGDYSYRIIPIDRDLSSLRIAHKSHAFDIRGIVADKNLALPLDRLKSLAAEGIIGSVAPRHFSFMGSISAPGRLIANTAPEVARMLLEDATDAVLLTPV